MTGAQAMNSQTAFEKLHQRNNVLARRVLELEAEVPQREVECIAFTKDQLIKIMHLLTSHIPRVPRLEATSRLHREIERLNLIMLEHDIPDYRDLGPASGTPESVPPPRGE